MIVISWRRAIYIVAIPCALATIVSCAHVLVLCCSEMELWSLTMNITKNSKPVVFGLHTNLSCWVQPAAFASILVSHVGELRFLSEPMDTIGVAGNWSRLLCNVSGFPIPSLLWYKDGVMQSLGPEQPSSPAPDQSKRQVSSNYQIAVVAGFDYLYSFLNISNLIVTDTGIYHCEAFQLEASLSSRKAQLLVHCKWRTIYMYSYLHCVL